MLSTRSTLLINEAYLKRFSSRSDLGKHFDNDDFYEFVYLNDFESWFISLTKRNCKYAHAFSDFMLLLHTGESIASVTQNWSWDSRRKKGRELLVRLAECFINSSRSPV